MPHRLKISDTKSAIDPAALLAVDRAVSDLRRGGIVVVRGENAETLLVVAGEGAIPAALDRLRELSGSEPDLLITGRRASILGLDKDRTDFSAETKVVITRPEQGLTAWMATDLADPLANPKSLTEHIWTVTAAKEDSLQSAAVGLAKIARMLPAVVVAALADPKAAAYPVAWAENNGLLVAESDHIFHYERNAARSLSQVSAASVPLEGAENTRMIAFRPADGGIEHLAILIGDPEGAAARGEPVLVRLHSECFTGDLLGSLRCDCGDQLRGAIAEIGTMGCGVLLYLAQEGRGIGLVNKLRAYKLQDQGLDTIDANEQLGYDADERVYMPAAEMLRQLGLDRVRLLTNNPDKVSDLDRHGITVVERVAHAFPSNRHNEQYLRTKAVRSGHLF